MTSKIEWSLDVFSMTTFILRIWVSQFFRRMCHTTSRIYHPTLLMHEKASIGVWCTHSDRKYLNECTPFVYVSLWYWSIYIPKSSVGWLTNLLSLDLWKTWDLQNVTFPPMYPEWQLANLYWQLAKCAMKSKVIQLLTSVSFWEEPLGSILIYQVYPIL